MTSRLNLQYQGLGLGNARMAGMNQVKTTTAPCRTMLLPRRCRRGRCEIPEPFGNHDFAANRNRWLPTVHGVMA